MIKVIKTEGKTAQEVQDYLDKCVQDGAKPCDGVSDSHYRDFVYVDFWHHDVFEYAGVDRENRTYLSDHLEDFTDFDILNLLEIKEAAQNVINGTPSVDEAINQLQHLLTSG